MGTLGLYITLLGSPAANGITVAYDDVAGQHQQNTIIPSDELSDFAEVISGDGVSVTVSLGGDNASRRISPVS